MARRTHLLSIVGALTVLVLIATTAAAKGPGGPGGGGGEEPSEEATNNLSVPAIFVPSVGVGTPTCTDGDDIVLPTPGAEDPIDGMYPGYWLQGEDAWQADCRVTSDILSAAFEWGDNLQFAPLKQRTPIRVEAGLLADATLQTMMGFGVDNLTPTLEDRNATYGTNDGLGIANYPEVRIWNAGVTVSIIRNADGYVAYSGPFSAEINSTGRIVYGYNWSKPLAGTYTITVRVPTVVLVSQDAATGGLVADADGVVHTATITVNVAETSGGGGGGGHGGGGGGGGH